MAHTGVCRRNGWAKKPEATAPPPAATERRCPLIDGRTISPEEFSKRYAEPNEPVLLSHLLDEWPACKKWTLEVRCSARVRPGGGNLLVLSEMLDTTALQRLYKHYRHVMFRVGDDNQHLAVNLKFKYECVGVQGWNCGELIGGSCAGTSCSTCLTMMMTVRCTSSTTRVSARARCVLVGLSVWSWQRSSCFACLPNREHGC